jgi:hypothetical protein
MKKTWTLEQITTLIDTNNKMVEKSLLQLYNRQTEDEKAIDGTTESNKMGFNGVDAKILSPIAKGLIKYGRLTPNQLAFTRKAIRKYAKQLTKIANTPTNQQLQIQL